MATTLYDFEGGVIDDVVTTGGGITDVIGSPKYAAGIHGTGIRYLASEAVEFLGVVSGTHSGSVYMKVDSTHTSGGSRGLITKKAIGAWRSGFKFIWDGDMDPTIGGTNEPVLMTWAVGDLFRFDWQYDASIHQIIWRVFKNANMEGTVHDATTTLDLSGDTDLIEWLGFGALNSSPAGTDITFDTLRVSDQLEWLAPFDPPSSGGVNVGALPASAVYVGATPAAAMYVGATKVWP